MSTNLPSRFVLKFVLVFVRYFVFYLFCEKKCLSCYTENVLKLDKINICRNVMKKLRTTVSDHGDNKVEDHHLSCLKGECFDGRQN
jgi:hypothetical protein